MSRRNPWRPVGNVIKTRGSAKLRVWPSGQGSLNNAARKFLFGDELSGYVRYERSREDGRFSLVSVAREMGLHVNKQGRVMLGPYAEEVAGDSGFDVMLREDTEFGRRLVFEEVDRG